MEEVFTVETDLQTGDVYKSIAANDIELAETAETVDFTKLDKVSNKILARKTFPRGQIDALFGKYLYLALKDLPSSLLSKPEFWQWMSLVRYRDITMRRLIKPLSETPAANVLSGRSLSKSNRNSFQRSYNMLKLAYPEPDNLLSDGFRLGKGLLTNQDAMLAICDRVIGLDGAFIQKHLAKVAALDGESTQNYVKELNAQSQVYLTDYL